MKKRRRINLSKYAIFIEATVRWLEMYVLQSGSLHLGLLTVRKYLTVLRTRGKKEAIAYCKGARSSILSWLAASDISNNRIASPKAHGVPKVLRFLGREVKGPQHYPIIRLVMSALYASRELKLQPVLSAKTITSPPITEYPTEVERYLTDFWSELCVNRRHLGKVPKRVYWKRFHLTTKTGPNGQAMWSALADLYALPQDLVACIGRLGGKRLASRMELLRSLGVDNFLHRFFTGTKSGKFRKISAISSQEGKTREVAILDYWSQTCLKGLHQYLFSILRRIPQDCTFNQGSFVSKLPFDEKRGQSFWSIDLTAATDRFPMKLIRKLISVRFGDEYANDWHTVMVGYPFWTHSHGEIRYATGNPMGAYSSWNSFALAHHYVVYSCCRALDRDWKEAQYVILGDDVVIYDDEIAKKYMETLALLGVEFSSSKTHTSPFMYEFAKRIVHSGVELTPFPISALWTTRKQHSLMLNVVDSERGKNWCFPDGIPSTLSKLFGLLRYPRRMVWGIEKLMFITHHVLCAMRGSESARDAVNAIVESYFPTTSKACNTRAELACHAAVLVVLQSSFESIYKTDGRALGDVATRLVMLITGALYESTEQLIEGRDNFEIDPSALIQSVPVLGVYGQIEEKYLEMRKPLKSLSDVMDSDWKTTLRSLQLPESDRIFYERNQDVMIQASFALAKALVRVLEEIGPGAPEGYFYVYRRILIGDPGSEWGKSHYGEPIYLPDSAAFLQVE